MGAGDITSIIYRSHLKTLLVCFTVQRTRLRVDAGQLCLQFTDRRWGNRSEHRVIRLRRQVVFISAVLTAVYSGGDC